MLVDTNSNTKSVLIIYTGGTMGMRHDENGALRPVSGYLTQSINELPEMSRKEMPRFDIIEYEPLLDRYTTLNIVLSRELKCLVLICCNKVLVWALQNG